MADVVPLKTGGRIAGIVPTTIEEVFRLAKAVAQSGLAPKGMGTPEQLTVAIMHGLEIGLPPMQAIQRIAVVNGRPTIWGDAVPALLLSRGFHIGETSEGEGDHRRAVCKVRRPDGSMIERSFSVADAKKAGLWNKAGPWQQYPDRMLQMRARGYAARDGAADVLSGLYLREELEDEPMKDVTPQREVVMPLLGSKPLPPTVGDAAPSVTEMQAAPDLIGELRADLECSGDRETVDEVWARFEIRVEDAPPAIREQAAALYHQHSSRVTA